MVDWGGKVAAWFADVCAGSAALAALIGTTAKEPLYGWLRAVFIVLVVVAVVAFLVLLFTGPRAALSALRNRRRAWERPAQVAAPPPLVVEITESEFENWKYVALIVALRVRITNTTGQAIRLRGVSFTYDTEGSPGWTASVSADERIELERELHARKERQQYGIPLRNYAVVPSHEAISGWVVEAVTRPASGTPRCTVTVTDTIGNRYEAVLPKQEAQTYSP